MSIDTKKRDVYEQLSKGAFICSNSTSAYTRDLFTYIDENYDDLNEYFSQINYELHRGDEFYYFSRAESKADITRKLDQCFKWIDLLDFFLCYDNGFTVGYRFSPQEVTVALKLNSELKSKLLAIKSGKSKKEVEKIQDLIKQLEKDGFVELENEQTESYKVLASFSYLTEMVYSINIEEE